LNQVSDYQALIESAHRRIEEMETKSWSTIEAKRREVIEATAQKCRDDLDKAIGLLEAQHRDLEEKSAQTCMEVTRLAVTEIIREAPESARLSVLIESLLNRIQSRSSFILRANPAQVDLTKSLIAEKFSLLLRLSKWEVLADPSVEKDRLLVGSAGESYIDVSIENWLALLGQELHSLKDYFDVQTISKRGQP
jgi:flagellar biosynthesis/type III secretory pathway protein FliH